MSKPFRLDRYPIAFLRPRIQHPYGWVGHIPFAFVLTELFKPARFVELGTDSGNSYLAFCQAISHLGLQTQCTAIDTWRGDEHARFYGEEVFLGLRAYHNPRYAHFSELLRCLFDEAVGRFEDDSIDLLHIDGLHTYEAVKHDFETWLPKMSRRGIVLLHDSEVREREFGVWRFVEELADRYRLFSFSHSNGLTIVQVGDQVEPDVAAFFTLAENDPEAVRAYFEGVAGMLIDPDTSTPVADIAAQGTVACKLYYRQNGEGYDEARSKSQLLSITPAGDRSECRFELSTLRPDAVRIDPANVPGVFGILNLGVERADGSRYIVEPGPGRVLEANGEVIAADQACYLRLVSFHDDPWVEIDLSGFWEGVSPEEPLSLLVGISYDAVLLDAGAQYAARLQDDALVELRARQRVETDYVQLRDAVTACGERLDALTAQQVAERRASQVKWEEFQGFMEQRLSSLDEKMAAQQDKLGDMQSVQQRTLEEAQQRGLRNWLSRQFRRRINRN